MKKIIVVSLLTITVLILDNSLFAQYKVNKSGDLEKRLTIGENARGWNDLYLKDVENDATSIVNLFIVKTKTNQTKFYVQFISGVNFGISNLYILLKLGNGKIYKSKPERLIQTKDNINREAFVTYFVFDKSIESLINKHGIVKLRASYEDGLKGTINADCELNDEEIKRLKDEVEYASNSYQKILKDTEKDLDNGF